MTHPINVHEYELAAREALPPLVYDYYAGGAHDEVTLAANRGAYERLALRYHVLRDVSRRSLKTTVLGVPVSMPILVAPTAFHQLALPEGEAATARAAAAAGTVMTLSTLSTRTIEDVCREADGNLWFQLYVYRDREATRDLVQRARDAGCRALVLTVDAQVWGVRERDVRNRFTLPPGLRMVNLPAGKGTLPQVEGSGLAAYVNAAFDPALTWKDLEWLAAHAGIPVVLKGLVRGDDAVAALDHGAAAVVVSNHGGRQLDGSPATLDVLPEVVEAVDGHAPVLLDGGVRRGTDVLKALALGATAVQIGRPVLWGLSVDGEAGVRHVLEILRAELDLAMALCGASSVTELSPDLVRYPR
jgi:4-hydroxymandelate oxidase